MEPAAIPSKRKSCRTGLMCNGFTLAELVISLAILTMAGLAAAALLAATGSSWKHTEQQQSLRMSQGGASATLGNLLRNASMIGIAYGDAGLPVGTTASGPTGVDSVSDTVSVPPGSGAACMFWRGTPDRTRILLGDLSLVEHDMGRKELRLWEIPFTAPNAMVQVHPSDFDDPSDVASFKALPGVTSRVIARGVLNCRFNAYTVNGSNLPKFVEFHLRLIDGAEQRMEYGTAAPRATVADTGGL